MTKRTTSLDIGGMTVQRTVSLPLSMVNDINGECLLTGKGFSKTLQLLITIGLDRQEIVRNAREMERNEENRKRDQEDQEAIRKLKEQARMV